MHSIFCGFEVCDFLFEQTGAQLNGKSVSIVFEHFGHFHIALFFDMRAIIHCARRSGG